MVGPPYALYNLGIEANAGKYLKFCQGPNFEPGRGREEARVAFQSWCGIILLTAAPISNQATS